MSQRESRICTLYGVSWDGFHIHGTVGLPTIDDKSTIFDLGLLFASENTEHSSGSVVKHAAKTSAASLAAFNNRSMSGSVRSRRFTVGVKGKITRGRRSSRHHSKRSYHRTCRPLAANVSSRSFCYRVCGHGGCAMVATPSHCRYISGPFACLSRSQVSTVKVLCYL